jgi:hypothetical protein
MLTSLSEKKMKALAKRGLMPLHGGYVGIACITAT